MTEQGETAEQGLSAESLRDVRARAEALASIGHGFHEQEPVNVGSLAWANSAAALARDAIALTLSVERLLVRVQELTDDRDIAVQNFETSATEFYRVEDERDEANRRVQEAERALRWIAEYQAESEADAEIIDAMKRVALAALGGDGQQEGLGYWVHVCRHGVDLDREICFRGCQEPRK